MALFTVEVCVFCAEYHFVIFLAGYFTLRAGRQYRRQQLLVSIQRINITAKISILAEDSTLNSLPTSKIYLQ